MKRMTDKDGNTYKTVKIGKQEWMAENLNVSHFRNGDPIPEAKTNEEWEIAGKKGSPTWCYYKNDAENRKPYGKLYNLFATWFNYKNNAKNRKTYGKLYNWYAVNDLRGLAPYDWHVPGDNEWTKLTDHLGGEVAAGGKLKETGKTHWESPNERATNETDFTALPGGTRFSDGSFLNIGNYGYWWSSAEDNDEYAWFRSMYYFRSNVYRNTCYKETGCSVRCVRD